MKIAAFILTVGLVCIPACAPWKITKYRKTDASYARALTYPRRHWQIYHLNTGPYTMRVLSVGDTTLPTLVLLHGSPGSTATFQPLIIDTAITNHVRLLIPERPGYGYTHFGFADTSIMHQATLLKTTLAKHFSFRKYALLGYSYGGSVAAVMASIDSARVRKLILVSASLAPGKEKTYKISRMMINPNYAWMFPKALQTASKEKLTHLRALQEVRFLYQKIYCPVYILQGANDRLIHPGNAGYMQQSLISSDSVTMVSTTGGHQAIIWKSEENLKRWILEWVAGK
jgi:pimeloyl-ACP methyl ester carboxylesterase